MSSMNKRQWQRPQEAGLNRQAGMVLVVLAFSIIGYIGFRTYAHPADSGSQGIPSRFDPPADDAAGLDVPAAPEIEDADDLKAAQSVLEGLDPGASNQADSAQLDMQLNGF